ncbi:MAG: hypothetical protein DMG96_12105 [Acidobacteria bacterium]|nr:MAG: hypothetical protein DMG98_19270 [Acidobacteriota bacterium]PYV77169.1 MAG: hypothetical protein DMG96_12105 [Acidobacteriota bacterium]
MVSKPVRFHPEAEQEYLVSLSWYRDRSHIAAADFQIAVTDALATIAAAPHRWPTYFAAFRKYTCVSSRSASSMRKCLLRLLSLPARMATGALATGGTDREFNQLVPFPVMFVMGVFILGIRLSEDRRVSAHLKAWPDKNRTA